MPSVVNKFDWMKGDCYGLDIPAHTDALLNAGPGLLTSLFQQAGSLSNGNCVKSIASSMVIEGGSTGSKLLIELEYGDDLPHLHRRLFVKFSRDFASKKRDAARYQMDLEVRFAQLSMEPDFPIVVPKCYFADFHTETGTGVLITQCIPFGVDSNEPQHAKAMDYRLPSPLSHYEALVKSLAKLAAESKKGAMGEKISQVFPFHPEQLDVGARRTDSIDEIARKIDSYAEFALRYPNLIPENIRSENFLRRFKEEAILFYARMDNVNDILQSNPELIALCHWNAHVDNAWFWRSDSNEIECGLFDWGNVSQMNVAMALWGCLSAAEIPFLDQYLDYLVELFAAEYVSNPAKIAPYVNTIKQHFIIYMASMGLAWLLDGPINTLNKLGGLEHITRLDPKIEGNETARTQLQIMTVFLNLWAHTDMKQVISTMD